MNIMLTDIRSLSLDMPELAVVADSNPQEFSGMLQQQLPQVPDGDIQAIDFKGYFDNISIADENPDQSSGTAPEAIWREYLAQHQVTVTTESEAVSTASPIVENIVRQAGQPLPATDVSVIPNDGEMLPVDGNRLPQNAQFEVSDAAILQKSVITPKTFVTDMGTTPAPDMEALPQTSSAPAAIQASIAVSIDKVDPTSVAPTARAAAIGAAMSAPSNADPLALKDRLAQTRATQPAVSNSALETGNDLEAVSRRDINPVADIAKATERLPVGTENPVETTVRNSTPGPVTDQSAIKQPPFPEMNSVDKTRVAIAETVPVTREVAPDKVISGRENLMAVETLPLREPGVAIESRSTEVPSQSSNGQSQGNTINLATNTQTAPIAAAANPGTPAISTPQPNPLPAPLETMSLTRNADADEWSNGLGERVNWMINQKQNIATIRLDPPFLGKLDVQIKVSDDATTITIQTQHAQTRDLIDATSARLRDHLQESGYQNVNVDVSQRQEQQQARSQSNAPADSDQSKDSAAEQSADSAERETASYFSGDGLVDTFA